MKDLVNLVRSGASKDELGSFFSKHKMLTQAEEDELIAEEEEQSTGLSQHSTEQGSSRSRSDSQMARPITRVRRLDIGDIINPPRSGENAPR